MNYITKEQDLQQQLINRFKNIPEHIISELLSNSKIESFPKGAYIYKENDRSENIYLILEGYIKIGYTTPEKKENLKVIMIEGDTFGVLNLLGQRYRKNFACAGSDCQLLIIHYTKVEEILAADPTVHLKVIKMISNKLLEHEEKMESRQAMSSEKRIIEWFKDLVLEKGQQSEVGRLEMKFFYTQSEIAALTDTSRQTVNAVLSKYRSEKKIKLHDKHLVIYDINNL